MIFYFSATGNSQHVSNSLLSENEALISVSEALKKKELSFDLKDDKAGFVFPVYFMGVPHVFTEFISKAKINIKNGTYVYIVITCGSMTANAGGYMKKLLKRKGIDVKAVFSVKMVDTYVPMFKIPERSIQDDINQLAEKEIKNIREKIENKVSGDYNPHKGIFPKTVTFFSYPFYKHRRFTKRFLVENSCVGCGLCEKICPEQAIRIEKGKPVWIKKQCSICLGCLHRCPKEAIQYGSKSKNSGRYFYK